MKPLDKNYLRLQFWDKIHRKNATEFQSFFEDIMGKAFPDFQKIRPYGNQGDGGNDGYIPKEGIYYQCYAPIDPHEKDSVAATKLKKNFETLQKKWSQIAEIKKYDFVFNDKGYGSNIEIEKALAGLKGSNPNIDFDKFTPRNLEEIFFTLKNDQILSLGFDIDSRNSVRIVREYFNNLEIELDRENGDFVLKSLGQNKKMVFDLNDESLILDYEILESRALQKVEKVKEAEAKYENLRKRYPNDPRAFLHLAEICLNNENFEKNKVLLKQAEKIDSSYWLLTLDQLVRNQRLGNKIDVSNLDEKTFPQEPRPKSNFYRVYSLFLAQAGEQNKAESFIERAIALNPNRYANYDVKILLLGNLIFSQERDQKERQNDLMNLLSEIDSIEQKIKGWGELSPRTRLNFNFEKIRIFLAQEDYYAFEKLAQESFELILQCYFDLSIEKFLSELLIFVELPPKDFDRLLIYLRNVDKRISDEFAKAMVLQFNFKNSLFNEGRKFFEVQQKNHILDLIKNLEDKKYHDVCVFLKEDPRFAIAIANTSKAFSELRRKIIESLPNDNKNIQKEKLLFLLNYDEKNINEAFDIIKNFDFSALSYFECKTILKIAQKKKAWEFVIKILERLLQYEKNNQTILQQEIDLFNANLELKRYAEVIKIGENILSDVDKIKLLNEHNKEALLGQIILTRLKRGEFSKAKILLEKHRGFIKSSAFKIGVETDVYLKNNDANQAIVSIVEGVKIIKTPTPEQYGSLYWYFVQIGNMIDFPLVSDQEIHVNHFAKFKGQERWYFVGNENELDATKITKNDKKYTELLGKKIGEKIIFNEKYRTTQTENTIENILPIEKYILWQSLHYFQQLSHEHRWDVETIEVPKKGDTIDTKYIIARLEDERKKRGDFFDLYCKDNMPLAFLAVNEGGLFNAIGCIMNENKGFVRFSSGDVAEINQQKEVAKRIISGESFYIDGTSATVLSETGLLEKICVYLPNLKIPQSVITLLFELKGKFNFMPGEAGHMRYGQGKVTFLPINHERIKHIENNFEKCIKILEAKPENIIAISMANKADCLSEQRVPAELCDACILAQKDNSPVLTEDFLYLQANEIETKKKAPEYCSTFALMRVLYEQQKITFEQYLNYFTYLSSYRFRFLHLTSEDIEKAVFGDGSIKTIQPEKIRQFNFPMTLSEEYGVPFKRAFLVVEDFLLKVLKDDTILPEMAGKIFTEIISSFPTNERKRVLGAVFLKVSVNILNQNKQKIIVGQKIQEKIDLLSNALKFIDYDLWVPR